MVLYAPANLDLMALWAAEDGRCEVCGRPMDRRVAQAILRDPDGPATSDDAWALACPFCAEGTVTPFADTIVPPAIAERLSEGLHLTSEEAVLWLRAQLDRYGVILRVARHAVEVWLPGIGSGWLYRHRGHSLLRIWRILPGTAWRVIERPQIRTRGLPPPRPAPSRPWRGFYRVVQEEVQIVPDMIVKTAKITLIIPPDQWPAHIARYTAEYLDLPIQTMHGLTLRARLRTRNVRRADRTKREIEAGGGEVVLMLQGSLLPDLLIADAGITVQARTRKPPTT